MRGPLWSALLAAGLHAGCGSPTTPTPVVLIAPIQVDSLDLVVDPSLPSGLGVRVQGVIGDGCSELLPPIFQTRQGAVVRITIRKQRPRDAICTQIAKLFDQVIPLEGEYPAGQYTVRVNDRELAFSVPQGLSRRADMLESGESKLARAPRSQAILPTTCIAVT